MDISWVLLFILQCEGHAVFQDRSIKIENGPSQNVFLMHIHSNKTLVENISKQQFANQTNVTVNGHITNNHTTTATAAPKTIVKMSRLPNLVKARF